MILEQDLQVYISDVFRRAALPAPVSIEPFGAVKFNQIYLVDSRYVVRISTDPLGVEFLKSSQLLRALAGRVRAPRVLHVEPSVSPVPSSIMICSYLPGAPLAEACRSLTAAQRRAILEALVGDLCSLHAVPPSSVPLLSGAHPADIHPEIQDLLAAARERRLLPAPHLDRMAAYVSANSHRLQEAPGAVVLHNDAHASNVLVHEGRYSGLIDFDHAVLGPAEQELPALLGLLLTTEDPDRHLFSASAAEVRLALDTLRDVWPSAFTPGVFQRLTLGKVRQLLTPRPSRTEESMSAEAAVAYHTLFEQGWLSAWSHEG